MPAQILVVDDMLLSRMILRAKLMAACYDTIMATNGAEALRVVSENVPDLILLDCNLPDTTGLEVCTRLRADPKTRNVPIILFSADSARSTRLLALDAGADEFFNKPMDDAFLMSRIRSLLRASAFEQDYQARATPGLRHGLAEAVSLFRPEGRVTLVRGRNVMTIRGDGISNDDGARIFHNTCNVADILAGKFGQRKPDILLLAPEVLQEHGMHLISELRARHMTRRIPIAVLLCETASTQRAMALDLGAEEVLSLPLDTEETQLRLRAMIKRKHRIDAMRHAIGVELDLASRDPLTGLFNRRYAMSRLSDIVATQSEAPALTYAMLLIDLDNFKQVNDSFGHGAGDEVLVEVSARMRDAIGPKDLLARYGGEEFLVVLPDADTTQAYAMAENIRAQIEGRTYQLSNGNYRLKITASIGVTVQESAQCDAHVNRLDQIRLVVDLADQALRNAKSTGRNRVAIGRGAQTDYVRLGSEVNHDCVVRCARGGS
jgi:two-component system cell cycle response regulator